MKFKLFSSKPVIGLDVQEHVIRLIIANKKWRQYEFEAFITQALPPGICVDGKIKNWHELTAILNEMVSHYHLNGFATLVALPTNLVRIQKLQVHHSMTPEAIESEIYLQLQHDLPGMKENLNIDYVESSQAKQTHQTLLFAAAREEYINQYVNCINASGLALKAIGVDVYVLRHFLIGFLKNQNKLNAIFHHNDLYALLMIFNGTEIIFQQRWNLQDKQENIWFELQNKLQLFAVTHPHLVIEQMIFHARPYIDQFDNELKLPRVLNGQFINPFAAYSLSLPMAEININDFLLAASCALSEVGRV